jgi:hypothetical protein
VRALIFVLCGVAWADASVPQGGDSGSACQAQIDAAARKMGLDYFRKPIVDSDSTWRHVTFTDGNTTAYIAIMRPSRTIKVGTAWHDEPDHSGGWWLSARRSGAWAAELGMIRGSDPQLHRFVAAFKVAADACLADANSGSSRLIPTK